MAATAAPTVAPTVAATGVSTAGGTLAAGGYLVKFTETNGVGETTASPESAAMTVAATNIPKVTFPALHTGNTGYNLYLTPVNGAAGSEVLYATGITTATVALAAPGPANSSATAPPALLNTGLTYVDANGSTRNKALELMRECERSKGLQLTYDFLAKHVGNVSRGDPVTFAAAVEKVRHAHTVLAVLTQACVDLGTAFDANPGTLTTVATPIGGATAKRVWP